MYYWHRWLHIVEVGFDIRIGADVRRYTTGGRQRWRGIARNRAVLIVHAVPHAHVLLELRRGVTVVLRRSTNRRYTVTAHVLARAARVVLAHGCIGTAVEILSLRGVWWRRLP